MRDLTREQYRKRMEAHGFKREPFMGYWAFNGVCISDLNGGDNRRAKLAYMLKEKDRIEKKEAAKTHHATHGGTQA